MNLCALFGPRVRRGPRKVVGRKIVHDSTAIQFRMFGGFPGSVNRTHPAWIEPCFNDPTTPVPFFGAACLQNTAANSVRGLTAADTAGQSIYGVAVRPFPVQQAQASADFAPAAIEGLGVPQTLSEIDILREGYIMVPVIGTATKGGLVYVWSGVASGAHIQGGFEAATPGGSGFQVSNAYFNGPADSQGIAEVVLRLGP